MERVQKTIEIVLFILFVPYFLLVIIQIVQYFTLETATRGFWDSVSLVADILGIGSLVVSSILWLAGFRSLSYEDAVKAATEGVIKHKHFQQLLKAYKNQSGSTLSRNPSQADTRAKAERTANTLERLEFFKSHRDFRRAEKLLSDGLVTEAVFITRRGTELFLRNLLTKHSTRPHQISASRASNQLVVLGIITSEERDHLHGFYSFASRVVHGTWIPEQSEALILISGVAELVHKIAIRNQLE